MAYRCRQCRYKSDKPSQSDKCPYCGKVGAMKREENADELLETEEEA